MHKSPILSLVLMVLLCFSSCEDTEILPEVLVPEEVVDPEEKEPEPEPTPPPAPPAQPSPQPTDKPLVILDTDIAEDVDDVGAVAVLHALADKGEIQILGMMASVAVEYGAPALDALNTYFKRPNIPVGTLKGSQFTTADKYLVYNKALATTFPNDLKHANNAPKAVDLYRQLLAGQADNSVTIITVGPLINLYDLMKSGSDKHSSLNGLELIKKKVKRFVMAGGKLPNGTSYNFRLYPDKSEYVINNWPTEYWLVPNELGDNVLTGTELLSTISPTSPIHVAYTLYKKAHPTWEFRPSWDQIGVYIAARKNDPLFKLETTGSVSAVKENIKWNSSPDKEHIWFQVNSTIEQRRAAIEKLMMHQPK